jgi:hypothetical protein
MVRNVVSPERSGGDTPEHLKVLRMSNVNTTKYGANGRHAHSKMRVKLTPHLGEIERKLHAGATYTALGQEYGVNQKTLCEFLTKEGIENG